jgi:hypothetical protein
MQQNVRLASLVAVVSLPGLSGSDWGVVDKLEEVLSIAGDDGQLLAVLAHGIELVGESCLELLTCDVRQLGFGDKRLGLRADKLLLENDDLGGVGLLVLQLRDLVGDLLLACMTVSLVRTARVANSRSRLGCTEASMLRMLLIVTRYWS